jgi:hypothetical protein
VIACAAITDAVVADSSRDQVITDISQVITDISQVITDISQVITDASPSRDNVFGEAYNMFGVMRSFNVLCVARFGETAPSDH